MSGFLIAGTVVNKPSDALVAAREISPLYMCLTVAEQRAYIAAAIDMETGLHGGFCAGLGVAYLAADGKNRLRLLTTFHDEFQHAITLGEF